MNIFYCENCNLEIEEIDLYLKRTGEYGCWQCLSSNLEEINN